MNAVNDPLTERLRRDLSSVDAAPVRAAAEVRAAAHRVVRRRTVQRRLMAGVACVALAGAALVAWTRRDRPAVSVPAVATTVAEPMTTVPPDMPSGPWRAIAADPRGALYAPAAVWTGSEVIAVGGRSGGDRPTIGAAAYDPTTDTWRTLSTPLTGGDGSNPLLVWTGSVVLLLGGSDATGQSLSAGQAYDPTTDTWTYIAPAFTGPIDADSPSAWTGSELLVWPDVEGSRPMAYDPVTNAWRVLAMPDIVRRHAGASVWTGSEWIIWGGETDGEEHDDGAVYDPATDSWRTLADSPLTNRRVHGVWTGKEMIIDAGSVGGGATGNGALALADGAAYDPSTDTWRVLRNGPAHPGFVPIWTGTQMLVFAKGNVSVYDVAADRWLDDPCCSGGAGFGTPVWTGKVVVVVGTSRADVGGAIYTPA